MSNETFIPKGAELQHKQFPAKDENVSYGSLQILIKKNGEPFIESKAKAERSFLINQGLIDENWQVIPWGNGFVIAPITNRST